MMAAFTRDALDVHVDAWDCPVGGFVSGIIFASQTRES
jgi:hypothetical protein